MSVYDIYMDYVRPFKGSPRYHRWSIISVIAATLERRVWLPLGGLGVIYPNLYIVLCGGPGTGKTTSSNLACRFLKDYNKRLGQRDGAIKFGPDKLTPAAMIKRFRKCTKTIKNVQGIGDMEQSAMYLHSTELATMIKDIGGGSLSDDLLKLYDCDDYFEKELASEGVLRVNGPCLNLLADTTPTFLSGFLPREESGTGLTARTIFATELGRVEMDEEVPDGDDELYEEIIGQLGRIHRMSGPFQVELKAQAWWRDWFPEYREKLFTMNEGSFMRYFYARKPIHARKIAMVLSAARDSERIIRLDDFQRAIGFLEEAEPYMSKSFGIKDMKHTQDPSRQIFQAIPEAPNEIRYDVLVQSLFLGAGLSCGKTEFDNFIRLMVDGNMVKRRVDGKNSFYSRVK